jgi:hypothetical protein
MKKELEKPTATSASESDEAEDWDILVEEIKARNAGHSPEEITTIIDEALAWAGQRNRWRRS